MIYNNDEEEEWNENNNPNEWSDEDLDIIDTITNIESKSKFKKSTFLEFIELEEQKERQNQKPDQRLELQIQESMISKNEQYKYLDYTFRQLCYIQIAIGSYFKNKQQIIIGDIIASYLVTTTTTMITFDEHQYLKSLWTHCNVPDIDIWYTNKYEEELLYLIQRYAKERKQIEKILNDGFEIIHGIEVYFTETEISRYKQRLHDIRSTTMIQELSILEWGIFMIEKRRMWGVDPYFY